MGHGGTSYKSVDGWSKKYKKKERDYMSVETRNFGLLSKENTVG